MTEGANLDQYGDERPPLKRVLGFSSLFRFSPRSPMGFSLVFPSKTFREIYKSTVYAPKLLAKS